jgi:ribosomal protein L32
MKDKYNSHEEFWKDYKIEHQLCPKCGYIPHSTTLVAYIVNLDKPEDFRDLNSCICQNCGDRHKMHDRISISYLRDKKIKNILE